MKLQGPQGTVPCSAFSPLKPCGTECQGDGQGFVGWQLLRKAWEYAIPFSDQADLSNARSCLLRPHDWAFKWRMDGHLQGTEHKSTRTRARVCVCVCVPGHTHICASACGLQHSPQQLRIWAASATYIDELCWILNLLREARDWNRLLMDTSQVPSASPQQELYFFLGGGSCFYKIISYFFKRNMLTETWLDFPLSKRNLSRFPFSAFLLIRLKPGTDYGEVQSSPNRGQASLIFENLLGVVWMLLYRILSQQ